MTFIVTANVSNLIEHLIEYQADHKIEYAEAEAAYNSMLVSSAESVLKRLRAGDFKDVVHNFGLKKPIDVYNEYADMIDTFNEIETDTIEINVVQLNQIVNNNWDWLNAANQTNIAYSNILQTKSSR
jgi:hypothetical protein